MLAQKGPDDAKERAIYYLSKFTISELNYLEAEKTCAALEWVLHRLRQYSLHYETFLMIENDPIKYLLDQSALVEKLAKWQILISEFDVQTMPQKSVKDQAIADVLAESPRILDDDGCSPEDRILLIKKDRWTMFFDRAVNLFGSGTGAALISPYGQHYPVAAKLVFPCTNNIAEYEACILGLQAAVEMVVTKLKVYSDSALIIL
ncbi:uncharacterized protein LOC115662767 [Syzygium oleosum]|uniref:uncharacterized protein LOC115662767 n=1 Tax=Syzygium oleosum TaxID=219896 RepID=UPI0011D1C071|nr:uncharacterized protein LOC115662767 [Syzygium oleosum]